MYRKWRERKVKAPLHLSLVFTFLTLALILLTIGLTEAAITGYYMEIYKMTLPIAFSMVVLGVFSLYVFVSNISDKGKKAFIPLIIFGVIIILLLFHPWNWWGTPTEERLGKPYIRLYSTGSLMIYSIVVILSIMLLSYRMKKNATEKLARTGAALLFYSTIAMLAFFIFFIIENALIVFIAIEGYSIFMYLAWISAMAFYILSYLSLVMPNWLVKRIQEE